MADIEVSLTKLSVDATAGHAAAKSFCVSDKLPGVEPGAASPAPVRGQCEPAAGAAHMEQPVPPSLSGDKCAAGVDSIIAPVITATAAAAPQSLAQQSPPAVVSSAHHATRPLATLTLPGARPYPYSFPPAATALVMIDFQRDFMEPGGFGAALGNDVALLRAALPGAAALLAACRAAGVLVVHTLEAHLPDLSDLHPSKYTRGNPPPGRRIGDLCGPGMGRILVRGEPGNGIVPELAPIEGEVVVYKPGKGAFYATQLHEDLQARGITHLLFAGVTTEVCVQTSMREANDRGYECALVSDATESYFPAFKAATLEMITAQGGIVGWTATSAEVAEALTGGAAATPTPAK